MHSVPDSDAQDHRAYSEPPMRCGRSHPKARTSTAASRRLLRRRAAIRVATARRRRGLLLALDTASATAAWSRWVALSHYRRAVHAVLVGGPPRLHSPLSIRRPRTYLFPFFFFNFLDLGSSIFSSFFSFVSLGFLDFPGSLGFLNIKSGPFLFSFSNRDAGTSFVDLGG